MNFFFFLDNFGDGN